MVHAPPTDINLTAPPSTAPPASSPLATDSRYPDSWFGPHRISVVMPALNEAANLARLLPKIPYWVHEVILVDGHSIDDTVAVAHEIYPGIRTVCQREGACGKGAALRQGFDAVTGDVIVTLDADGSTDPGEIPLFVGALLAGADFAKGTRISQGAGSDDLGIVRRMGNWGLTTLCRVLFLNRFTDLCYGYNSFWSAVVPQLHLDANGFEVEAQMSVRALLSGLRVVEVPSRECARYSGTSNLHAFPDGWRVLRTIIREWIAGVGNSARRSHKRLSRALR
jgi:glycosyltransferase involved in cell wall biosynthesis